MNQMKGYLFTITAAVCFGLQPLLAGVVYQYGVGSKLLALLRVFFMVPLFLIIVLFRRERFWKINVKQLLQTALLALTGAVLTMFFLFESFHWIATGSATALNFCYPVVVLILCIVLFRERISRPVLISILLCMIGVCLFCDPQGLFSWYGFFLALASGITYGIYVFYLEKSKIMETLGFMTYTFWFFLISSLLMLPVVLMAGEFNLSFPAGGWLFLLLFSIDGGIMATVLLQVGVKEIGSQKASILAALEPVTSIAVGALFLNEPLRWSNVLGTLFVIASTIVLILGQKSQPAEQFKNEGRTGLERSYHA